MVTLTITFKDEHQKIIEEAMRSGRYVSESDLVAAALSELKAREHQVHLDGLRAEVNIGLEQLDRGEGREWNVTALKARARELQAAVIRR